MEQIITINLRNNNGKISISTKTFQEYSDSKPNHNISLKNIPIDEDFNNYSSINYFTNPSYEFANIMLSEETEYQLTFESNKKFNEKDIFPTLKYDKFEFQPFTHIQIPQNDNNTIYVGILNFKGFVGKTFIDIKKENEIVCKIPIEVKSKKLDYIKQYPSMIADLSEIASGLIYESKSPLYQDFELNDNINQTRYEDFMILEYIFRPENLPSTIEYLSKNLYSNLEEYVENVPTSLASNIGPNELVDIISSSQRLIKFDNDNSIIKEQLNGYIPSKINEIRYKDNIDTSENRFYKYFLEMLNYKIINCLNNINEGYVKEKLLTFQDKTNNYLSQKYFQDISKMDYAPLNSQVLQKKEGYRDIFEYFLMLEFSFKMEWEEVTNDFKGYQKKLSELYEYWCYFKLIKILKNITNTEINFEDIYKIDENGWTIKLHENIKSILHFNYENIEIELFYTKKFNQNTIDKSYSLPFKPDYTIILKNNDKKYLIHFDAKYKVDTILIDTEDNSNQKIDIYKNPDIYKMHTYKDAISQTIGAYIFYPGDKEKIFKEKKDSITPSIGAFPLNPGNSEENEMKITKFLKNIIKTLN